MNTGMQRFFKVFGAGIVATAVFVSTTGPAFADEILVIPIRAPRSGAEGSLASVGTVAVPADLVGRTCQVIGRTNNQVSVHPGNDLLITTNGQTFVVPDFEDEGFVVHQAGEVETVGATIELAVRFGPDGISSGGFSVSIECEPDVTTTSPPTTAPTTEPVRPEPSATASTTAPPATAPAPTQPVTTAPAPTEPATASTQTDSNPPVTPAPTEPPPAGPSETVEPTSTAAPTSTTEPSATTEPPPAGPTAIDDSVDAGLPATGSSTGLLLGIGTALITFGFATQRVAARRPS